MSSASSASSVLGWAGSCGRDCGSGGMFRGSSGSDSDSDSDSDWSE